jgi:type IV fimbrial biogenesis protein FimT
MSMTTKRGFTLIELMIGIAIMTILLFLALPNFSIWLQNTQIRTGGEAILNGLQLARAEAVRQNTSIEFQMTSVELPMRTGWRATVVNTGEVIQTRVADEGSRTAVVTATPGGASKVTFSGFGSVVANNDGSPVITEMKIDSNAIPAADSRELCITVNATGALRMCDPQVAAGDPRACAPAVPAGCL